MSFTIKSSQQNEQLTEARLDYLHESIQKQGKQDWKSVTVLTFLASLIGAVLSLVAGAASVSGSLRSLLDSIKVRPTYVLFILGILVFQLLLASIIWVMKKRNREIIELRNNLTDIYLSVINKSALNPNLKPSASR